MHYEDKKTGFKFDAVSGVPKENTVEAFEELFAANKATEEGELPLDLMKQVIRDALGNTHIEDGTVAAFDQVVDELAIAVLAADRASRQVANKAEVEPSESYKSGYVDGMEEGVRLALWADKPSEKFPEGWPDEVWLNAGDDELGPFSEYDEVSWCSAPQGENDIRYIREDLLATPPATTGASTAPVETFIALRNRVAELEKQIREQSVGASTVLTDERIAAIWHETACAEGEGTREHPAVFARAIEREVAAQAGQVAVPGWISVDERYPEFTLQNRYLVASNWGVTVAHLHDPQWARNCFQDCVTKNDEGMTDFDGYQKGVFKVTHWMPLPAAPSPAKESK